MQCTVPGFEALSARSLCLSAPTPPPPSAPPPPPPLAGTTTIVIDTCTGPFRPASHLHIADGKKINYI